MKKLYIIPLLLFFSGTLFASNTVSDTYRNAPSSIIFTEQNVEFAIYPDGQFDFYFRNPSVVIRRPGVNISYNAGYNYNPYLQFDDYGAVIQIESVPVYYDYYGRISRAGNVLITYNRFGRLSNVGGMYISYNTYGRFGHFRGYINRHNRSYVYQPWHRYYTLPPTNHSVIYSKPYRSHYVPQRIGYNSFRKNYRTNRSNMDHNYYRPSTKVSHYSRGIRSDSPRVVRKSTSTRRSTVSGNRTSSNTGTRNHTSTQSTTREINGSGNRRIPEQITRPEVKNNQVQNQRTQTRASQNVSTSKRTTRNDVKTSERNNSTRSASSKDRNKTVSKKPKAENSRKSIYNRVSTSSSQRSQSSRRR